MKKRLKFGVIGLGCRGRSLLKNILLNQDDVDVVAVCDIYQERIDESIKRIKDAKNLDANGYLDYKDLFKKEKIDAVLVSCSWEMHTEVAIYSLNQGVAVAMEVGGCYSEDELWNLIHTQERTKTPFMFMENCCYGKAEVLATNMARKGVFGEIVHATGAYGHDLRDEIANGNLNKHYRLRNYIYRNCDNYPTHDIGPIAKLLNINAGNRFISLVSLSSKAVGLKKYVKERSDKYPELQGVEFKQGDIVSTIITCANGETVVLKLDTTLPRFYSRDFSVRGTKGFYEQNTNSVFIEGQTECAEWDTVKAYQQIIDNGKNYHEYLPDEWRNLSKEQLDSGHGGMDYFEFREFIDCIKEDRVPPIDVYDAATWMSISLLSEKSIALGGAPVYFSDFTSGKWLLNKPKDVYLIKKDK